MTKPKFKPEDLMPQEASFKLSGLPDKVFTLKKFSLRTRLWCDEQFGEDKFNEILKEVKIGPISKIVHHLLKDTHGLSLEEFQDQIFGPVDQKTVTEAFLTTVAGSKVLQDIEAEQPVEGDSGNAPAPTGASGST